MKDHDIVVAQHASYDSDGFLGVQWDFAGENGGGPGAELHSAYGHYSMPMPPSADGTGCYMHRWYQGAEAHVMMSHDPRAVQLLPDLKPGESISHGPVGNFTRHHDDGRITEWTSTKPAGPLDADALAISRETHPAEGFFWASPWGKMSMGLNGFHVIMQSGARLDVGAIGGLPAPLDAVASYAALKAAAVTLDGQIVSLGAGATEPVILHSQLVLLLEEILAAVTLAAAAPGAGTPNPAVAPAIAAITAQLTAGQLGSRSVVTK